MVRVSLRKEGGREGEREEGREGGREGVSEGGREGRQPTLGISGIPKRRFRAGLRRRRV